MKEELVIVREMWVGCETLEEAKSRAPWAAVVARIYGGGFIAFRGLVDFQIWLAEQGIEATDLQQYEIINCGA